MLYVYLYLSRACVRGRQLNRKFVTETRGGVGKGKKNVRSKLRFVEKKSVCRVRFVPLTRRSLVQASNSRRARSSRAHRFFFRSLSMYVYIHYCTSNLCFIYFFLSIFLHFIRAIISRIPAPERAEFSKFVLPRVVLSY